MKGMLVSNNNGSIATQERLLRDAAFLRQALERDCGRDPGRPPGHPILIALSGLPGTGKSHFAGELTKLVPILVLESDRVRKLLVPKPKYTQGEHSRVFDVCHLLIEEYLSQGRHLLFDATNLTEYFRRPLYRICDRLSVPLVLVRFTASRDTVRHRLEDREAGLHPGGYSDARWSIYCRLFPSEEPIRRQHFTVDSSSDICPVLEDVARLAAHANQEK